MTTTDFDASKLEPGVPPLNPANGTDVLAVMAYSQAISLKRIADALEVSAVTEATQRHYARALAVARSNRDHDRAKAFAETAAALDAQQAAAQPGADSEGWIPWHGGECPVAPLTPVTVRFRDGDGDGGPGVAKDFMWTHDDRVCVTHVQIVAYKLGT